MTLISTACTVLINDLIMTISVQVCVRWCIFKAAVLLTNALINITSLNYLSDIDLCVKTQCAAVLINAPRQCSCLNFDHLERSLNNTKFHYCLMKNCKAEINLLPAINN